MLTTRLLLIRHAESTWNAAGRWQGHGDPPLSERGREQAAALASRLGETPVDAFFASDLQRARETAAALGTAFGREPVWDPRLRELDVGTWTGLTRDAIAERDGDILKRFEAEEPDVKPGGGESRRALRQRVRPVIADWVEAHPGGQIALVTHLGVIRALHPGANPGNAEVLHVRFEELVESQRRAPA